jgi:hypothetical protein
LLRCSATGFASPSEFERAIRELGVGSLVAQASDRPDAPPWVTFGPWRNTPHEPMLGIVVRNLTTSWDATGRPITEMRYVLFPWTELAAARMTYSAMYAAVEAAGAFEGDTPLTIDPLEAKPTPGEDADHVSLGFTGLVASSLLNASVAIVGAGGAPVERKLQRLDWLVSSLPFGCRAEMNVSTWVNSATLHHIQLGFSNGAREPQLRINWNADESATLLMEPGRTYLQQLSELEVRYSADAVRSRLAQLTHPTPLDRSAVEAALADFGRPLRAARAVRGGRGDVTEVRWVLQHRLTDGLASDELESMLVFLLENGTHGDVDVLAHVWPQQMYHVLVNRAVRALDKESQLQLDRIVGIAQASDTLGEVLLAIVQQVASRDDAGSHSAKRAVRLFVEHGWPDLVIRAKLRPLFMHSSHLAVEVMASQGQTAVKWLDAPGQKAIEGVLGAFKTCCGLSSDTDVDAELIGQVVLFGDEHVESLLRQAKSAGTLPNVIPGICNWLVQQRASPRGRSAQLYQWLVWLAGTLEAGPTDLWAYPDAVSLSLLNRLAGTGKTWPLEAAGVIGQGYSARMLEWYETPSNAPYRTLLLRSLRGVLRQRAWTTRPWRQVVLDLLSLIVQTEVATEPLRQIGALLADFGRDLRLTLDESGDAGGILRDKIMGTQILYADLAHLFTRVPETPASAPAPARTERLGVPGKVYTESRVVEGPARPVEGPLSARLARASRTSSFGRLSVANKRDRARQFLDRLESSTLEPLVQSYRLERLFESTIDVDAFISVIEDITVHESERSKAIANLILFAQQGSLGEQFRDYRRRL